MYSNIPKYDLASRIASSKLDTFAPGARLDKIDKPQAGFKEVLGELASNLNSELNAPDNLMKDLMSGSKNVDIHDVMTAIAKTEVSVNVATQTIGKVVSAYERVMQISV